MGDDDGAFLSKNTRLRVGIITNVLIFLIKNWEKAAKRIDMRLGCGLPGVAH